MSDERLSAPLSLSLTGSFSELLPPFSLISGILPILTKDEIPLELCEFLRVALATCDGAVARTLRAPWGRPREGPPPPPPCLLQEGGSSPAHALGKFLEDREGTPEGEA